MWVRLLAVGLQAGSRAVTLVPAEGGTQRHLCLLPIRKQAWPSHTRRQRSCSETCYARGGTGGMASAPCPKPTGCSFIRQTFSGGGGWGGPCVGVGGQAEGKVPWGHDV